MSRSKKREIYKGNDSWFKKSANRVTRRVIKDIVDEWDDDLSVIPKRNELVNIYNICDYRYIKNYKKEGRK
jgi:hypothetical protein